MRVLESPEEFENCRHSKMKNKRGAPQSYLHIVQHVPCLHWRCRPLQINGIVEWWGCWKHIHPILGILHLPNPPTENQ